MQPDPSIFVSKGLFPENLPPVFTSRDIWDGFASLGSSYGVLRDSVGGQAVYNASKRGGQRRLFRIPHPAFVRDQALFFQKHWGELENLLSRSTGSLSRPAFYRHGPRHVRITSHAELPSHRLRKFSRFNLCLITDVSRFFPSVYTHSIPWAINGKAEAKADTRQNSQSVWGNKLDFILRQSQSRQTVGIAVGPDTSKIISEILMSSVDDQFIVRSGSKPPTFLRHVDDYWIGGDTQEECERHLSNLRTALRDHELDINESKTKIVSSKYVFGDDWPVEFERELERYLVGNFAGPGGILPLLSSAVSIATEKNDDGVIRRTVRKIDEYKGWSRDWVTLEHFLAQCSLQFPHSFDYVARVVAWRRRIGNPIDTALWIDIAQSVAKSRGSSGYDSEAVWALWLLKELGVRVVKGISEPLVESCGSLTKAFLAHMGANGMLVDRQWRGKLVEAVEGEPLSGSDWPLTLELVHLGKGLDSWLADGDGPAMRLLHEQRRSIIDWSAPPKVFGEHDEGPDGGPDDDQDSPENALEHYGDDYGEFRNEDEPDETDDTDDPEHNDSDIDIADLFADILL
ncbi:RNA-directed DNA polymerase [Kaistia defluvii]|uniref:Reverse transcriptase domain-containing protein n=1 Tax=Kaistia defluvii TaxID=410841 RepID=A0ABV2R5D3_9HYPH